MKVLISKKRIQKRIKELGDAITTDYKDREVTIIALLKGSLLFLADLVRHLDLKMQIELIQVNSYGNDSKSSGTINIIQDITRPIIGEEIIIVEDIVDSGLTLQAIINHIKQKKPRSIQTASLLVKPEKHKNPVTIKYSGFEIADHFVVGMGMDYAGYYRNLDHIAILDPKEQKDNDQL